MELPDTRYSEMAEIYDRTDPIPILTVSTSSTEPFEGPSTTAKGNPLLPHVTSPSTSLASN